MSSRKPSQDEDTVTEMRAIVDLVDANVSPVADAEAWEAEIDAHRQGDREEPPPPGSATLKDILDISALLA